MKKLLALLTSFLLLCSFAAAEEMPELLGMTRDSAMELLTQKGITPTTDSPAHLCFDWDGTDVELEMGVDGVFDFQFTETPGGQMLAMDWLTPDWNMTVADLEARLKDEGCGAQTMRFLETDTLDVWFPGLFLGMEATVRTMFDGSRLQQVEIDATGGLISIWLTRMGEALGTASYLNSKTDSGDNWYTYAEMFCWEKDGYRYEMLLHGEIGCWDSTVYPELRMEITVTPAQA